MAVNHQSLLYTHLEVKEELITLNGVRVRTCFWIGLVFHWTSNGITVYLMGEGGWGRESPACVECPLGALGDNIGTMLNCASKGIEGVDVNCALMDMDRVDCASCCALDICGTPSSMCIQFNSLGSTQYIPDLN